MPSFCAKAAFCASADLEAWDSAEEKPRSNIANVLSGVVRDRTLRSELMTM